jgi:PD-(D/E)XK nuclease superfamily
LRTLHSIFLPSLRLSFTENCLTAKGAKKSAVLFILFAALCVVFPSRALRFDFLGQFFNRKERKVFSQRTQSFFSKRRKEMTENELSNRIIGLAIEVHKGLGPGLLESAYKDVYTIK